MSGVLSQVGTALKGVGAAVMPAGRGKAGGRALLWVVHFVLLAAVLVGLHFLNARWQLGALVRARPVLRDNWLPILFLLLYALGWLGWWLWRLLQTGGGADEFPDITAAWNEASAALTQAGIDVRGVPLFLVLGHCEGREDSLFGAALLKFTVKQAPGREGAPVSVWANREAVYVTCTGASLLGAQAALMTGTGEDGAEAGGQVPTEDDQLMVTNMPGQTLENTPEIQAILARARQERRLPTHEERRHIRTLLRKSQSLQSPLRASEQIRRHGDRFAHLCRLLAQARAPYVPLNGILLLLPLAATDSDQDAIDTGDACQRDLAVVRDVLRVNCPAIAVVCDLEAAPGFREFLGLFPDKQRHQRIGQRCPLVPVLEKGAGAEGRAAMLDSLASWVCASVVPRWVYKHFHLEGPGQEATPELAQENARLFLFLNDMRARGLHLGQVLDRGLAGEDGRQPWFGGCYLVGTGADADHEQGFVAGVFRRLTEEETRGMVSWTDAALADDAACHHWTTVAWAVVAVLVAGAIALGVYLVVRLAQG
jgi:hypothetical protein